MSYNGSGTFNINSAGQPVVTATTITSTAFNLFTADIGTGLSTAVTKDGQTTPTANLPMGTFKHTGVGDATARTMYASAGQVSDSSLQWGGTGGGTVDIITISITPAITAYAAGQSFRFLSSGVNTTNVTLNVNSVGAKAVTKAGATALVAGDIPSGAIVDVVYDGTRFQVGSIVLSATAFGVSLIAAANAAAGRTVLGLGALAVLNTVATAQIDSLAVEPENLALNSVGFGFGLHNGMIVPTVAASALTIAIKTLANADAAAADPVRVIFNDETQATGTPDIISITAANSLVISSGSTMGFTSAIPGRLWIVLFNDGGTVRLGAINCLSGTSLLSLDEGLLATSTAEGGAGGADSAQVFYTGAAVTTKPYKILGYLTWNTGLVTAGTWAAGPTVISQFGPGSKKPGDLVQEVLLTSSAWDGSTTIIPDDDTIPQNTEGEEWAAGTVAFTARSPANLRDVFFQGQASSNENRATVALFVDSTADALTAGGIFASYNSNSVSQASAYVRGICADVTAHTFKMRFGPGSSGTAGINGGTTTRRYGGVCFSTLGCREIMA